MTTMRRIHSGEQRMREALRAVAHDASAVYMLLAESFGRLRSLAAVSDSSLENNPHARAVAIQLSHTEVCLEQLGQHLTELGEISRGDRVVAKPRATAVEAVVDEVLYEQRDLLSRRAIHVEVRSPLPVLWCNEARLKQVVTNLVRNAAIHGGDPKFPRIVIASREAPAAVKPSPLLGALCVYDNGPGIAARHREEIFLPGRQLPGNTQSGSGMGLAIVRQFAEEQGGRVFVDAECHDGTRFVVLMPLADETRRGPIDRPIDSNRHEWQIEGTAARGPSQTARRHRHAQAGRRNSPR
jgi:signal transduction histidine kinase